MKKKYLHIILWISIIALGFEALLDMFQGEAISASFILGTWCVLVITSLLILRNE